MGILMLIDKLVQEGILPVPDGILKVHNVDDYLQGMDKSKEDWLYERDILCFVPPFERTWFEAKGAGFYTELTKLADGGYEVALSMFINGLSEEIYPVFDKSLEDIGEPKFLTVNQMSIMAKEEKEQFRLEAKARIEKLESFIKSAKQTRVGEVAKYVFALDGKGGYISHTLKLNDLFRNASAEEKEEIETHLSGGAVPLVILTLNFLHCKNVSLDENKLPQKLIKARRKRGKVYVERFYTLSIQSIKQTLKSEGNSKGNGIRSAMHICRGHFKVFDEKGLFGKYHGTFYWPAQVRGSKEAGEVKKDYSVVISANRRV